MTINHNQLVFELWIKNVLFFFFQISNVIAKHAKIDLALFSNSIPNLFSKWLKNDDKLPWCPKETLKGDNILS